VNELRLAGHIRFAQGQKSNGKGQRRGSMWHFACGSKPACSSRVAAPSLSVSPSRLGYPNVVLLAAPLFCMGYALSGRPVYRKGTGLPDPHQGRIRIALFAVGAALLLLWFSDRYSNWPTTQRCVNALA